MKLTVYKCDLCKHLFIPTEKPTKIREKEWDICPGCLDKLVARLEADEILEKAMPEIKDSVHEIKENDKMKIRQIPNDRFYECFDKGMSPETAAKTLKTGEGTAKAVYQLWLKRRGEGCDSH